MSQPADADRLRRKYEKKGWSKAKIQRAIQHATRKTEPESFSGLRDDVAELLAATARDAGESVVLVHWYDGDLETERIAVRGRMRIPAERLTQGSFPFEENVLLWIDGD